MKREIKFRGIATHHNKLVYGDLIHGQGDKHGRLYILPHTKFMPTGCNDLDGWHVKPETVGEYTGQKDKNGKEIFEGDIVKSYSIDEGEIINIVEFDNGTFKLVNPKYLSWPIGDYKKDYMEIIGNIFENPDLI